MRSKKQDLQDVTRWKKLSAELLVVREMISRVMIGNQDIMPKTVALHPHLDIIIKNIDDIRWKAKVRMADSGGFDGRFADDCFYPVQGERKAIKNILNKTLDEIQSICDFEKCNDSPPPS